MLSVRSSRISTNWPDVILSTSLRGNGSDAGDRLKAAEVAGSGTALGWVSGWVPARSPGQPWPMAAAVDPEGPAPEGPKTPATAPPPAAVLVSIEGPAQVSVQVGTGPGAAGVVIKGTDATEAGGGRHPKPRGHTPEPAGAEMNNLTG